MHYRQQKTGTVLSVSVVICTRNRPRSLRGCLLAVLQQSMQPDEIVVVDNAANGEAGVGAGVKRISSVRVVRERRLGIAGARNRGYETARGSIVAYLPIELVFHAQKLIEERGGFSRGEQPAEFRREMPFTVQAWRFGTGGNMSFRRDAIRDVGGFDRAMKVGEDIDALYRTVRAGWVLRYEPQALMFHRHIGATRDLRRRLLRLGLGLRGLSD